jgi:hypothetical protein
MPDDEKTVPALDARVDEYAATVFAAMGQPTPLPKSLVAAYQRLKAIKDHIHPGRLSPEGFAFVVLLSDINDQRVSLDGDDKPPRE